MPRKSPRKRIAASQSNAHFVFEPSADDWERVEAAYDHSLVEEDRTAIRNFVNEYFEWAPFEQNAPFKDDLEEYINQLRTAAVAFWRAPASASEAVPSDAVSRARIMLELQFDDRRLGEQNRLATLHGVMTSYVTACDRALVELREQEGFEEGRSWQQLIRQLTGYLKEVGLPTGASHEGFRISDFVRFVRAIQALFPEALRRHYLASDTSLAKEITRARAIIRDKRRHKVVPEKSRRDNKPAEGAR